MNFLTLFARNLRRGPYTEPFPFGPATPAPKRLRAPHRIRRQELRGLPAVREAVPVGRHPLLPHARRPRLRLLSFDLRLLRHVRVLLPDRGDPPDDRLEPRPSARRDVRARRARPDPADRLRRMRRQRARHRAQRRQGPPAAVGRRIRRAARALPEVPQQVSQEPGEDAMTRLPADIQTQLAAAAPGGIEYSSTTAPHGVVTGWCGLANSEDLLAVGKMLLQLGARLAMVSALQPAGARRGRRGIRRRARATPPSRKRRLPRPSAARRSTASPTRSTTTSCSAATS